MTAKSTSSQQLDDECTGTPGCLSFLPFFSTIRRWLSARKARGRRPPALTEKTRMTLALAIAEQYVLVSQDCPLDDEECSGAEDDASNTIAPAQRGSTLGSTLLFSASETTVSRRRTTREAKHRSRNTLLNRVWRPRTVSNGSTICGSTATSSGKRSEDNHVLAVASRENPLCC
ncbi:hypothetical protein GQ54DRAFT_308188 [Martensiomyces pterosporus]|nr:hypothetical protein GQ54DRAFT_308188 [Martensiomyces pterosporus]